MSRKLWSYLSAVKFLAPQFTKARSKPHHIWIHVVHYCRLVIWVELAAYWMVGIRLTYACGLILFHSWTGSINPFYAGCVVFYAGLVGCLSLERHASRHDHGVFVGSRVVLYDLFTGDTRGVFFIK